MKTSGLVHELLQAAEVDVHSIQSRCKAFSSFAKKIEQKKYADPFTEVSDFVGIRVTVYYIDDVQRVCEVIDREFTIIEQIDKKEALDVDRVGYLSVHRVVKASEIRERLSEWSKVATVPVEIQVRTLLQDAWASIDHQLRYKTSMPRSNDYKRKLYTLAGLLEIADLQFSFLRAENTSTAPKQQVVGAIDRANLLSAIQQSRWTSVIETLAAVVGFEVIRIDEHTDNLDPDIELLLHILGELNLLNPERLDAELKGLVKSRIPEYFSVFTAARPCVCTSLFLIVLLLLPKSSLQSLGISEDIVLLSKDAAHLLYGPPTPLGETVA